MTDPAPPTAPPSNGGGMPAATIATLIGGSAASIIVWVLSLYKVFMPAGVESQSAILIATIACYIF
jgi:hypothetical protein